MFKLLLTLLIGACISTSAFADKLAGNIAIHIAKRHYHHPVRLLHPYLDVWHMKGPMAEKVALNAFAERFAQSNLCSNSSNADVVVLIEPQMFYNAQLRVFHTELIVQAFTKNNDSSLNTQPLLSIKKEVQQNGELGITPDYYMEKSYRKAMEMALNTLATDATFLATLGKTPNNKAENICQALDDLPSSRFYY